MNKESRLEDRVKRFPVSNIFWVYGGVRGDDFSSATRYVRERIIGSGIKVIVDLGEEFANSQFKDECEVFGVKYFHAPIDDDIDNKPKTLDIFLEIFRLLDEGDFYISCNNVFLIDIVLSCYWMFKVADRGFKAPKIIGFRDKNKANQRLSIINNLFDSMNRRLTLACGKEVISNVVFQSRKDIIANQYKKCCSELSIEEKRELIEEVQKRIDLCIGIDFKVREAKELIEKGYPFQIRSVTGTVRISDRIRQSDLFQLNIRYEDIFDMIKTTDIEAEKLKLFNYIVEKYFPSNLPFAPKLMIRNGKIAFSEEASQLLGLTDGDYVKLRADDNCSSFCVCISPIEKGGFLKLQKSDKYFYVVCTDLLKALGLYSTNPSLYELVKEDCPNDKTVFKLNKIITVTDPKKVRIFKNKEELRSVVAMLSAKI